MFKKLKDKIAEDLKQSPLKSVQQLAQAVVSPSSSSVFEPSSSNDKFCIEEGDIEEDEKSSTKSPPGGGFTSVALTGHISSPPRRHGPRAANADTENLFPVFESQPTNFHVQSDWESASEVEDRSQLEHISKENLYDAYRKVYGRYNKMKNKYQELVTHYRQLEREKEKAKTVLTETQDKALLRISELREQCVLEQQAKAHLEEALRNELEEKDHIINSLKTKVQYLKNVNESAVPEIVDLDHLPGQEMDNLIDFTENSCVSKVPLPSIASSNLEKLEWLHQQLTNCNKFLVDKTTDIDHLKSQLEELKKENLNIRTNSLETEASVRDEIFAFQNQSQEETKLYHSLVSIAKEFRRETKLVQSNLQNFLLKEDKESITDSFDSKLSVSTNVQEHYVELSRHEKNEKRDNNLHNDELKKLYTSINDLEMLNQKLIEEKKETEKLQENIGLINQTLDVVKTRIQNTNKLVEEGNCDIDSLNLTQVVENHVIKELNLFITNFMHTNSELNKLKSLVVNLENELKIAKDELHHIETKDKTDALSFENQNENLIKMNKELTEQLERLQNENNDRLAEQKSLHIELYDMKQLNEKLQVQIEETRKLVESSEQMCRNNKKECNKITISLEEEKKALQNTITKLNQELDETKTNVSSLINLNDSLNNQILVLQKENDNIILEKENLQSNIEEFKNHTEQCKHEYLAIKTINNSLTEELETLKKEQINTSTEKIILLENIEKLEISVKDLTDALIESKHKYENVQGVLLTSMKDNDDVFIEKNILDSKVIELENKVETMKMECSKIQEDKLVLNEELSSLKKEFDSVTAERKHLNEQNNALLFDLDSKMKDCNVALEENKLLSTEIFNLKNELNLNSKNKNELQLKIEDLDKELKINRAKFEDAETANKQLTAEKSSLNEEISSLYDEKKELQTKIEDLENINSKKDDNFEETNILKKKIEGYEKELKVHRQDYEKSLNKFKNEIMLVKNELEGSCRERKALQIVIEDLNTNINRKESKFLSAEESNKKLSDELRLSKLEQDDLITEKENLLKKLESLESKYLSAEESNNKLLDELRLSKLEQGDLTAEKEHLLKKFESLESKYLSAEESNKKLSDELRLSKLEQDDLTAEKENLLKKLESLESKYLSVEELNNKLLDELRLSKLEQDNIVSEKEDLLKKFEFLEKDIENNKNKEISSLSSEIDVLKQDILSISNRENVLLTELDKLIKEREYDQINHESVQQEKNKLSGELILIKKEFEEMVLLLNDTKDQLQNQREACNKLHKQVEELSESYKNKCNDILRQQQESAKLRTDADHMTNQFNEISASLTLITIERNTLLNNFLVNLNTVKIIRQIQIELFNFVGKLKKEVTDELNDIKLKISTDLMFQVSSVLKTNEDHDRQIYELQCKSKEEVDLYNSKIKNLQTQIQNTDQVTSNHLFSQDQTNLQNQDMAFNSIMPIEKDCELKMKTSEFSSDNLIYKNRCNELDLSLKQALSIMRSIHSFLMENSKSGHSVLSADGSVTQTMREEHIAAMKSFIDEHQTRDLNSKYSINKSNSDLGEDINDDLTLGFNVVDLGNDDEKHFNQPLETKGEGVIEKEFVEKINSSKYSGQSNNTSLEIQQLKQEIKFKEDIIKKLQFVIEEFEQGKEKMTQLESQDSVPLLSNKGDSAAIFEVVDRSGTNMNMGEHINWLEHQNKILNEKLETMKQAYETNISLLTTEYENKLKENEEERKINEFHQSGKEKKFILNEMKEEIENLQHDLDQRGDAFEKLYEEHQQTLKERDENVRQLRTNYEKEMREQDKKWRSCLDRKLAEEELRHKDEINMLSHQWAAQKKELEMASQLAVSVVESGSSSSDLLRRQVQSLTLQITQLQNERCKCQQRRKSPTPFRNIQDCTEMEYLRNILYDYMMGKEPVVLAKVLCALMKFNENQTNNIVNKEEQRLTLVSKTNLFHKCNLLVMYVSLVELM